MTARRTLVVRCLLIAVALLAIPTMARAQSGSDSRKGNKDAMRAAGPCFDNTNRYVNCNNGTVTDTVTGLIWLRQADCLTPRDYSAANNAAALLASGQCGLTDHSVAGDWRLPTIDEWKATLTLGDIGCTNPRLPNDAGTGCFFDGAGSSFVGVAADVYWSSSTAPGTPPVPPAAVSADLNVAHFDNIAKGDAIRVWPVRSGPR